MKTKTIALLSFLCLAVLIILGSCATMKSPDKLTYERFCGTWANEGYQPKPAVLPVEVAKWIINPEGTMVGYDILTETGPAWIYLYTVEKRWVDTEGNHFYHVRTNNVLHQVTQYELWRIDKYTSILEIQFHYKVYPDKIDPEDIQSSYLIYYRY